MRTLEEFDATLTQIDLPGIGMRQLALYETALDPTIQIRMELGYDGSHDIGRLLVQAELLDEAWQHHGIAHSGHVLMINEQGQALVIMEAVSGVGLDRALQSNMPGAYEAACDLGQKLVTYLGATATRQAPRLHDIWSFEHFVFAADLATPTLVDTEDIVAQPDDTKTSIAFELATLHNSLQQLQESTSQTLDCYQDFGWLLANASDELIDADTLALLRRYHGFQLRFKSSALDDLAHC